MRERIFWIFGLFNLAILIFAWVVWIAPAARSLQTGRESVRLLERRYSAMNALLRNDADYTVLPYEQMLPALAGISGRGATFGLETHEFSAGEISSIARLSPGENFYEMRVVVEYAGNFYDAIDFLRDFQSSRGYIRSFTITNEEVARLRLQFSIFGR
ncbi:MAG: hypothetical protein FWC70_01995 [Defluviitaleaceae bacterium]|nr:hypothetical protein [Defluviitaleaceae bacterium]